MGEKAKEKMANKSTQEEKDTVYNSLMDALLKHIQSVNKKIETELINSGHEELVEK